ncbi:high chlorophyll fluorescent 107-like protein [Drosera capensis]
MHLLHRSPPPFPSHKFSLFPSHTTSKLFSLFVPSSSSASSEFASLSSSILLHPPPPLPPPPPITETEETEEVEGKGRVGIDEKLQELAKKWPMFEPRRGEVVEGRPLDVNLDLSLYRARQLTRRFRFDEAQKILERCIYYWPEDGRAYVAMGKLLRKQSKLEEARTVYEKGCQATQGENAYLWQCWADLENKLGNTNKARELFDAATVANKSHIAAWHGWAMLELEQGNVKKGRSLLSKALKYGGGNEYVYQSLALLEAKAGRCEEARSLFRQAVKHNPKSCASWLAWAQLEIRQENNVAARQLFERAVQASPKNRFAWHIWALFEADLGKIELARNLIQIGHLMNPKDPVLLQSLALLEYKHSLPDLARVLFRRAAKVDPRHQPIWFAWGWMEWKEGNLDSARELYRRVLAIDSKSVTAARCLQAWGVLEQRAGDLSAARRLFRSSLSVNSQSYITWRSWAALEENQGNPVRADEIRNLYFQQRTEVVDDPSWVTGFLDIIDPALDRVKRLFYMGQNASAENQDPLRNISRNEGRASVENLIGLSSSGSLDKTDFDLASFVKEKLSLDISKLDEHMQASLTCIAETENPIRLWRKKT